MKPTYIFKVPFGVKFEKFFGLFNRSIYVYIIITQLRFKIIQNGFFKDQP